MDPYKPPKTIAKPSFMDGKSRHVSCPHCEADFDGHARKTFLGFRKYTCASCSKEFNYPLSTGYRIAYWVLLIGALMFSVKNPDKPSVWALLIGYAVAVDLYLLWKRK